MTLANLKLPVRLKDGTVLAPKSLKQCRFPRTVYRIAWDKGLRRWMVTVSGQVICWGETRREAVDLVKDLARVCWKHAGIPSQVWVANKTNGRFSTAEATYGLDDPRSKG